VTLVGYEEVEELQMFIKYCGKTLGGFTLIVILGELRDMKEKCPAFEDDVSRSEQVI